MSTSAGPVLRGPSDVPEISVSDDIVDRLLRAGMIDPPSRPGCMGELDHYQVMRLLGEGGMGVVLLGRDARDGSEVAIKILRPELLAHEAMVERFLREATMLSCLCHPHILSILHVIDRPTSPAFVTPYITGGNLGERLAAAGPLRRSEALPVARSIGLALRHAHQNGIIHRDVKPSNILIDHRCQVLLGDFGLSRTLFQDPTIDPRHVAVEGTTCYMAPEIVDGQAGDTRCDIYSWGAVLYEMLCGSPPYSGRDASQVVERIRGGPPTPVREIHAAAPQDLAGIAEAAMARELRERYASMGDALEDLRRLESDQPPAHPTAARACRPPRKAPAYRRWILVAILLAVIAAWAVLRFKGRDVLVREEFSSPASVAAGWPSGHLGGDRAAASPGLVTFRDGALVIVARASSGSPARSAAESATPALSGTYCSWVDVPADLAMLDNATIDLTLEVTGIDGGCAVLLTDGAAPADVRCQRTGTGPAVRLFDADVPKTGAFAMPATQLRIRLHRSSHAAEVEVTRGGRAVMHTVEMSPVTPCRLRLQVWTDSAAGGIAGRAQLIVDRVVIQRGDDRVESTH